MKKKRVLSVFSLVMINIIAIDSLRSLPVNAEYGYAIVFFYILAGILFFIPCALISAELATGWPKTGGAYVWVREAFGKRWGFVNIWLQWIYNVVWYPTILAFIATSLANLIHPAWVDNKFYMVACVLVMFIAATVFNSFGMRISSLISEAGAILGTIIPMIIITVLGVVWIAHGHPIPALTWHSALPNFHSFGDTSFLIVVLFSLMGLEMSAVHAEEVKSPERDYPRALFVSAIIILLTLILGSLAVAIVMPADHLSLINGLNQAFETFFQAYHLGWMFPIVEVLIVIGGFAGMAAWVIGPAKGLMVAAKDRCAPKLFAKTNRFDAPYQLLIWQAVVVIILSSVFLIMPSVDSAYWLLTALTAQLALVYYLTLFVAALYLRYKYPTRREHAFLIPGGKVGIWIVCLLGIIACIGAIVIGYIPPSTVKVGGIFRYELLLVIGMVVFVALPLVIYQVMNKRD